MNEKQEKYIDDVKQEEKPKYTKIVINKEIVELDHSVLSFTEATLNQFLQHYASRYNYYVERYAESQYIHARYEDQHGALCAKKFREFKEIGGSDKLCEMKVESDQDVMDALEKVRISKHHVNLLWGYLRSMDRAHENAINMGYNIRKEMAMIGQGVIKKYEN